MNKFTYFLILLSLISCSNESNVGHNKHNNHIFKLTEPIRDSLKLNAEYKNSISFKRVIDSVIRVEKNIDTTSINTNQFLFVYTFDIDDELPKKIEDYNEDESTIFIPYDDKSISFNYSFTQKGYKKLVLVYLDTNNFETKNKDSIRIIEQYANYVDTIFVE